MDIVICVITLPRLLLALFGHLCLFFLLATRQSAQVDWAALFDTNSLSRSGLVFLPGFFEDIILLLPQVREALHLGLVQAVHDRILSLCNVDLLDLDSASVPNMQPAAGHTPFSDP